jgi:hypothetical protein
MPERYIPSSEGAIEVIALSSNDLKSIIFSKDTRFDV